MCFCLLTVFKLLFLVPLSGYNCTRCSVSSKYTVPCLFCVCSVREVRTDQCSLPLLVFISLYFQCAATLEEVLWRYCQAGVHWNSRHYSHEELRGRGRIPCHVLLLQTAWSYQTCSELSATTFMCVFSSSTVTTSVDDEGLHIDALPDVGWMVECTYSIWVKCLHIVYFVKMQWIKFFHWSEWCRSVIWGELVAVISSFSSRMKLQEAYRHICS